jgi:hypothetical protein
VEVVLLDEICGGVGVNLQRAGRGIMRKGKWESFETTILLPVRSVVVRVAVVMLVI